MIVVLSVDGSSRPTVFESYEKLEACWRTTYQNVKDPPKLPYISPRDMKPHVVDGLIIQKVHVNPDHL